MAIGKGSMERAAKIAAPEAPVNAKGDRPLPSANAKGDRPLSDGVKPAAKKSAPAKKAPAKKPSAPKKAAAAVITPTEQVMELVEKNMIGISDAMPIYFY